MCAEHGRSGIALVCSHVRNAVLERATLPPTSTVLWDIVEGEPVEHTYCTACVSEGALPMPPARISDDQLLGLRGTKLDAQPVCCRCLAARASES